MMMMMMMMMIAYHSEEQNPKIRNIRLSYSNDCGVRDLHSFNYHSCLFTVTSYKLSIIIIIFISIKVYHIFNLKFIFSSEMLFFVVCVIVFHYFLWPIGSSVLTWLTWVPFTFLPVVGSSGPWE